MNKSYSLQIETLSPVHIGAGQEKYWQKGLDYYYNSESKWLYILNQNKLMKSLSPQELRKCTSAITEGQGTEYLKGYFNSNDPEEFSEYIYHSEFEPFDDIRTFIRTGLGQPYIPGSSLKGAIRSSLFSHIYKNNNIAARTVLDKKTGVKRKLETSNEFENNVFGVIENNLMHFIQVSDAFINQKDVKIFHTKTFNLRNTSGKWEAGWKHGGETSTNFRPKGFVFSYEAIDINSKMANPFSLSFDSDLIKFIEAQNNKLPEFISIFKKDNPIQGLFAIINSNTRDFLNKEIDFFKRFPDGEGYSSKVIKLIEDYFLSEITDFKPWCVLRIGQGSGFYSITGDWRLQDHTKSISNPDILNMRWNNRTRQKEPTRYKSRKTIFNKGNAEDGEESEFVFDLFGFIKLTLV